MNVKTNKIVITILAVISLLLLCLNISLALFGDRAINTGIIQFKEHKLNINILDGSKSLILTTEELTIGNTPTRTIKIENPSTSTSCVLRIWLEFEVKMEEGGEFELDNNYLSLSLDETKFTKSLGNKYYYNNVLNSSSSINNLVLNFKVSNDVGSEYQNKNYRMRICFESIQSNKEAVKAWESDYTSDWYNKVNSSLTSN